MATSTLAPRVTRLEARVDSHEQTLLQVCQRLSDHDEVIDGRKDQPGMISRLASLEKSMIAMDAYHSRVDAWIKILSFVGGAIGLSIIGLIWSLLTGAVQIVPVAP